MSDRVEVLLRTITEAYGELQEELEKEPIEDFAKRLEEWWYPDLAKLILNK